MPLPYDDLVYLYDASASEAQHTLRGHIAAVTRPLWGDRSGRPLALIRWDQEKLIASACGMVCPGWLNLELLWVEPPYRNQGIGRGLLQQIEAKALSMGAHSAYLWTQEFEAPDFYRRYGYEDFVTLEEFCPGHQMIGMRKQLSTA